MKKLYFALISFFLLAQAHSQITVSSAIVPQFIQGNTGTNNNRTPFYFWVDLTGLTPGATYRYYTTADTIGASNTSNGAGNSYLINHVTSTFRRTTSVSLSNTAGHDSLVASGSGTWSGWMGIEPTNNARFATGNTICPRIMFNNGSGGTAISQRVILTAYPVSVINYGTTSGNAQQGSFFYDSTIVAAKNFAALYDNTSGTGRPVSIAVVEDDGMDIFSVTSILLAYRNNVDTLPNRWGTLIPNNLANGIRLLQYLSFTSATSLSSITDADGNWCFANTVNPSNGTTAIRIRSLETIPNPEIQNFSIAYCANDTIGLTATGMGTITWYTTGTGGTAIGTGNVINVPAGPVFYAQADTNGCTSGRDSVFFTIDIPSVYYADNDFDAYGDPNDSIVTCNIVIGYVGNNLDCDDSDPAVNPDATEVCNGIDDNCNNQVDEGCVSEPEFDFGYPVYTAPPPVGGNATVDETNHTITLPMFNCFIDDTLNFYIRNAGNDTLTIAAPVNMTQTADQITFTVIQQPQGIILPGDSSLLAVQFELTGMPWGADTAVISIGNNDTDENPYVFSIYASITCAGVVENSLIDAIRLYPTPAEDICYLDLDLNEATDVSVQILDLGGKEIFATNRSFAKGMNQIVLPVGNLVPGMYLVKISDGTSQSVRKLIRK